jgi:hypothetical protein
MEHIIMRKQTSIINLRVTADDKAAWQVLAKADKMTLADFIRSRLDTKTVDRDPVKPKRVGRKIDSLLLANVGRVGSNLNQIARWANQYKSAADASEILLALVAVEQLLLSNVQIIKSKPESTHVS